jgi:hypothetical protein
VIVSCQDPGCALTAIARGRSIRTNGLPNKHIKPNVGNANDNATLRSWQK